MVSRERDVYIQFYPSDWRGDEALQACSLQARGLWVELMCLAFKAGGFVRIGGRVPTLHELARQVRATPGECSKALAELQKNGVCSVDQQDGAVYSRRMVRDLAKREINRKNGARGGNPALCSDNRPVPPSDNRPDNRTVNRGVVSSDKPQNYHQKPDPSQTKEQPPEAAPHNLLVAVAHAVIEEEVPDASLEFMIETFKRKLARARIPYDGRSVQKAFDAAQAQRRATR